MSRVVAFRGGVTQTRITIAVDEVRVKFPDDVRPAHVAKALGAAWALKDRFHLTETTLRGKLYVNGAGGFTIALVNTNGRTVGRYYVDDDFTVRPIEAVA